MNELLTFIFLGLIQGFTEPLPISSSGHLIIFQELLGVQIPGISFEAFINFGSTIAIILFFYQDITQLIKNFWGFTITKGREHQETFYFLIIHKCFTFV